VSWLGSHRLAEALTGLACGVLSACDTGTGILTGIGEPLGISGGQFIEGSLPGSPPGTDAGIGDDSGAIPPLTVTGVTFNSTIVEPGQAGKPFGGNVSLDAVAVGVALEGLGTGYWVRPTGAPDATQPGTAGFSLTANFNPNDAAGVHNLLIVGIGESGQAGIQYATPLCFISRIPDNGHACDPSKAPPNTIFTLQWDTNFDLDLHVRTPGGREYSPRQLYGGPFDAGIPPMIPPGLPHIDRDSLANCVPDGLNQEDLIFPDPPSPGQYTVYVDPFASCGQPWAHFKFTLYQVSGACPACSLAPITSVSGEVLASQETGGTLVPLLVAQVNL
jgi:hypothetical protein